MKVHEEHKKEGPNVINLAVIVVSTSRFKELQQDSQSSDKTIPLIKEILTQHDNINLKSYEIIADESDQLKQSLNKYLGEDHIHFILFSGGTGLSPKDVSFETISPLFEKELTGFGELFRYLSYNEIGSSAMLSRASGGKIGNKGVFLLPGSPKAVKLALEKLLIPEFGHVISQINKEE